MYKKTTNKDRVLSQIDFVIGEMKFAIESIKIYLNSCQWQKQSSGILNQANMMICLRRISSSCSDGAHQGNASCTSEAKAAEEESNEVIRGLWEQ